MLSGVRHKTLPLLGLVLLIMVTAACSSSSPAESAFEQGQDYREQRDLTKAIEAFSEAIKHDPQYWDAYYFRGWAHADLGQHEKAIEDFTEVIRIKPENEEHNAYYYRGLSYKKIGKSDEADQDFIKAKELGWPFDILGLAKAPYDKGVGYANEGNSEQKYGDDGKAKSAYEKAIEQYGIAIEADPTYADAYYYRGMAYARLGKCDEALHDFQKASLFGYDGQVAYAGSDSTCGHLTGS